MVLSQPRLRHVEMIASRIACVAASRVDANVVGQEDRGRGSRVGTPTEKSGGLVSMTHLALGVGRLHVVAVDRLPMVPHRPRGSLDGRATTRARVPRDPRGRRWQGEEPGWTNFISDERDDE